MASRLLRVRLGQAIAALGNLVSNFFVANADSDRGGVHVAALDADGDNKADVATATGDGQPARVRIYLGKNFPTGRGEPNTFQDLKPFSGIVLNEGVFVGC